LTDRLTYQASMARDLLENEVLNDALARMERDLIEEMLSFGPEQDAERRLAADRVNVARDLKSYLKRYLSEKKMQDTKNSRANTTA
jgi:hypothetical protein